MMAYDRTHVEMLKERAKPFIPPPSPKIENKITYGIQLFLWSMIATMIVIAIVGM